MIPTTPGFYHACQADFLNGLLGRTITLEEVASSIPIRNGASSLADMGSFLSTRNEQYAITSPVNLDMVISSLKPKQRVAILHSNKGDRNHFMVVLKDHTNNIVILDGKKVIRNNVEENLKSSFTGTAMVIGEKATPAINCSHAWHILWLVLPTILLGLGVGLIIRVFYRKVRLSSN